MHELKFIDNGSRVKELEQQLEMMSDELNTLRTSNTSTPGHNPIAISSMDKFNGRNWDVYITQFECIADCCCWTDSEKMLFLLKYVQGEAAEVVFVKCSASDRSSYKSLKSAMQLRFGSPQEGHLCHFARLDKLLLTKEGGLQGHLPAYCAEVRYLVRKAFHDLEEGARSKMEVDYFVKNIEDAEFRRTVCMKSPKNLRQAREYAEVFLRIEKGVSIPQPANVCKVAASRKTEDGSPKEQTKGHQQLFYCLKALTKLLCRRKSRNSKKNRRCYRCRCVGHYVYECLN